MLEPFGHARSGRYGEAEQHPGHRGMHAGLVHQCPGQNSGWDEQPSRPRTTMHQDPEDHQREQGRKQGRGIDLLRVEHRDHGDRQQVVDHGQGQQKGTQGRGQVSGDHRQHRDRKRDVRCRRNRPAAGRAATGTGGERNKDHRRYHHSAHRRDDRQRRAPRIPQIAYHELALELQADDEEEDRQQSIGCPGTQSQVQMQSEIIGAQAYFAQRMIGRRPWGIRPHQRESGCRQQHRAPDGFPVEDRNDAFGLRPRSAGEQSKRHGGFNLPPIHRPAAQRIRRDGSTGMRRRRGSLRRDSRN